MNPRMYSVVEPLNADQKKYVGGLRGQAKVVWDELVRVKTPRLAEDINRETKKHLVTTQEFLRVTLYYIIVFKGRGVVKSNETTRNTRVDPIAAALDRDENRFTGFDGIEIK